MDEMKKSAQYQNQCLLFQTNNVVRLYLHGVLFVTIKGFTF